MSLDALRFLDNAMGSLNRPDSVVAYQARLIPLSQVHQHLGLAGGI